MRVLLIAPPGAGKGTQGAIIASHFNVPHIATGDLLRDHVARRTALGLTVADHINRGELVPDDVVLDMLRIAFTEVAHAGTGYVLDGLPRTMHQAHAAYQIGKELGVTSNVALHLKVDDAEVTRRLLARAVIEGRSDDTPDVIATRLKLYHDVTSPIVDWYAERGILITVDSTRPVRYVAREILTALTVMASVVDVVPEADRRPIDLSSAIWPPADLTGA
jgi:adenylate kinase